MNLHPISCLCPIAVRCLFVILLGGGLVLSLPTAADEGDPAEAVALPEGHFAPALDETPISGETQDEVRIRGTVTSYTEDAIYYDDAEGAAQSVAWSAFDARFVDRLYPRLIQSRDIEGWYRLVTILAGMEDGKSAAMRVLRRIERLDPESLERVERVRAEVEAGGRASSSADDTGEAAPDGMAEIPTQPDIENPRAWPDLTDEQQAAAVERLESTMQANMERLRMPMGNTQTDRFIVFTDLPRDEARYWVSLLDRLYDRMCGVFDLEPDDNIWQGKCVFVLFNDIEDYYQFSAQIFGFNAQGSGGYCSLRDGGDIYIIMYKHRDEQDLASVLVHEASHAFLFRFVSSYGVPNWLHEGLAEYLVEVLLDNGRAERRLTTARRYVQQRGRLDNFLSARNIIGEHYGIAYDITDLMIDENRRGYVDMIRGIKEGLSVEAAFEEHYGASLERVLKYYGRQRLQIDDLPLD